MKEFGAQTSMTRRALGFYYQRQPWESEGLYEKSGIRIFQKTLKMLPFYRKNNKSLRQIEQLGKVSESIHMANFVAAETFIFFSMHEGIVAVAASTLLNTIVNLYPVMSQRYNRIRLNKIKEFKERRENK